MEIYLNNNLHKLNKAVSVKQFLDELKLDASKGFALAVNGTVVPRDNWSNHQLEQNDKILLIKASQGG